MCTPLPCIETRRTTRSMAQVSAVNRCTDDVWRLILCSATYVNRRLSNLEPASMHEGVVISSFARISLERRAALELLRNTSLVCRSWREMSRHLLLEWPQNHNQSCISDLPGLLSEPLKHGIRGDLVRRLVFNIGRSGTNFFDDLYLPYQQAIMQSIGACHQLEEFSLKLTVAYQSHPAGGIISALLQTCSHSLRVVELPSCSTLSITDLSRFLSSCPQLRVANFGIGNKAFRVVGKRAFQVLNNDSTVTGSSPIVTLVWSVTNVTPYFLRSFATFDFPLLKHLVLSKDNDSEHKQVDQWSFSIALLTFLQSHGHKLSSIELCDADLPWIGAASNREWSDLCPNLDTLVIDLRYARFPAMWAPHTALRRVGFRSFFCEEPHSLKDAAPHITQALKTVSTLCGRDYPNMEVIRCLDIQPADRKTRALRSKYGAFADAYRVFSVKASNICGKSNVRLEDCLGQPMALDFAPFSAVYYPGDAEP